MLTARGNKLGLGRPGPRKQTVQIPLSASSSREDPGSPDPASARSEWIGRADGRRLAGTEGDGAGAAWQTWRQGGGETGGLFELRGFEQVSALAAAALQKVPILLVRQALSVSESCDDDGGEQRSKLGSSVPAQLEGWIKEDQNTFLSLSL